MPSTAATGSTKRVPMDSLRKTALAAGIPLRDHLGFDPILFYSPVKELNYIFGPGPDTRMIIGGILEMIVGLAGVGAVLLVAAFAATLHDLSGDLSSLWGLAVNCPRSHCGSFRRVSICDRQRLRALSHHSGHGRHQRLSEEINK